LIEQTRNLRLILLLMSRHIVIQLPNAVTTVSSTTTHTTTDTIAQPSPVHLPPEKIV
jgi:hypothetical protein